MACEAHEPWLVALEAHIGFDKSPLFALHGNNMKTTLSAVSGQWSACWLSSISNRLLTQFTAFLILLAPASLHAQQMPQDNWRYDGLQFSSPTPANYLRSIAIGSGGVYVGEGGTSNGSAATKVIQFTEGGVFVRRFTPAFTFILGLACDPAGNVYVLDCGDSRVKMYAADGTFIRQWGAAGSADGQFSLAAATGTTMLAVDMNSQIYVCDPGNTRVQVFDSNGNFLRKWGQAGTLPGQFAAGEPRAVVASADGFVHTTAGGSGTVALKSFDNNGVYKNSGRLAQFSAFNGLAITADGLAAYRETGGTARIQITLPASNYFQIWSSDQNEYGETGLSFSKRGDLFAVVGTTVRIYEREYSSVQNSLLPPAIPQPIVLASSQRTGTSWLDIDYQVTDADSATVTIAIYQVVCANRFESVQWVCIFNRLTFFHSMPSCHFLFDNPKAIGFHG